MLIVHLFVSYAHVNLCHFFSSSWCQGSASTSACGSSWTFLFTFLGMDLWATIRDGRQSKYVLTNKYTCVLVTKLSYVKIY